jgi:hypothetical protein
MMIKKASFQNNRKEEQNLVRTEAKIRKKLYYLQIYAKALLFVWL